MAEDIVPGLYKKMMDEFNRLHDNDERIKTVLKKIEDERAESEDAALYAMYVGEHATKAVTDFINPETMPNGRLYFNIANRTIKPLLQEVHKRVIDIGVAVTEMEDKRIGIHLKVKRTKFPEDRVDDLINKLVAVSKEEANG